MTLRYFTLTTNVLHHVRVPSRKRKHYKRKLIPTIKVLLRTKSVYQESNRDKDSEDILQENQNR